MQMQSFILFGVLIGLTAAVYNDNYNKAKALVDMINSQNGLWTAEINERFARMAPEDYKRMTGFIPSPEMKNLPVRTHEDFNGEIPDTFDAREHWPKCKDVISDVRDQGQCNSCWAVSSSAVMTDRLCIATEGKHQEKLSAYNLMCGIVHGECAGSDMLNAFNYYQKDGVVSGGDYNSNEGCQPYPFGTEKVPKGPKCNECYNKKFNETYKVDEHYGNSTYALPNNETAIRAEILQYGPIVAGFFPSHGFSNYRDGIYEKLPKEQCAQFVGHAVRVIGWGQENNVKYWLASNSWGRDWAKLDGLFKIRRGTDECGFESHAVAGLPKLNKQDY